MANGLDERRALAARAGASARSTTGSRASPCSPASSATSVPDGTMDLADDCLAELDIVIASVHSAFSQDEAR